MQHYPEITRAPYLASSPAPAAAPPPPPRCCFPFACCIWRCYTATQQVRGKGDDIAAYNGHSIHAHARDPSEAALLVVAGEAVHVLALLLFVAHCAARSVPKPTMRG